jgi:Domain of Unknown Function (DUF1080)
VNHSPPQRAHTPSIEFEEASVKVFRHRWLLCLLAIVSFLLLAAAPPTVPVARLIQQLGSDSFGQREGATRALDRIGEPALALLREATRDLDPEVRVRAGGLVRLIQGRLARTDFPREPAPKGAVVLFDGKSLGGWVKRDGKAPAHWEVLPGGVLQVTRGGDIMTERTFGGRFRLHVEFRVPDMPWSRGQARGNSGVFLQGRYEMQILDSYALAADHRSCGSVYGLVSPKVNACKAPLTWQSFDIDFSSPVFQEGRKVKDAQLSALHNGVKVHDDVALTRPTEAGLPGDLALPGPVLLQDRGNPVQFRNVWLLPVPQR